MKYTHQSLQKRPALCGFKGLSWLAIVCSAILPLQAQTPTLLFTNIWSIAPGSRPYVSTNGAQGYERGISLNPLTTNVVLASRSNATQVLVLDGATGALIRNLDVTGVSGGTFAISKIAVADDGVIYGANLSGSATVAPAYKIYRWASESDTAPPVVAYSGDPGYGTNASRMGDSFAIRGTGTNTQIIASGSSGKYLALFITEDGTNFTARTFPSGVGAFQKGLAFGLGNTVYSKLSADATLKLYTMDTNAGTVSLTSTYSGYASSMVAISIDPVLNIAAGPLTAASATPSSHLFNIYDFSSPGAPVLMLSTNFPGPYASDSNLAGEADILGDRVVGVSAANGVMAFRAYWVTNYIRPSFTTQPRSSTNMLGGFITLSVSASGSTPKSYQWYFNDISSPISDATNTSVRVANLSPASQGNYFVVVTNQGGAATSSMAFLAVSNSVLSTVLTPLYTVAPGSRNYLADDNNQRGLAYNPVSNRLILASRTPGLGLWVLNANTGAELHSMDVSQVTGGTLPLNLVRVAEDGAVYACNLESGGAVFKVYRWADDNAGTPSTTVFDSTLTGRLGDTMAIRGGGVNTQIIFGEQAGGKVHLFTTTDGVTFTPTILTANITTEALRNGLAFGRGNTYWSKDFGGLLRYFVFDPLSANSTVVKTFAASEELPTTMQAVAYDPASELLVCSGLTYSPDHVRIYDAANITGNPVWLDTEFYATDNANTFGTAAFDFGNGKLYALDSHNGIAVYQVNLTNAAPAITVAPVGSTNNVGENVLLGVNAAGYPRTYQWYLEGTALANETNGSLVLVNAQVANTTNYSVIVSNSLGTASSSAQVWLRPTVISQPTPEQIVPVGASVSMSVFADGNPVLAYQWQKNSVAIGGATDALFSILSAQVTDIGDYQVVITNLVGSATSQVAKLIVQPPSTPGTGTGLRGDYYTNVYTQNPFGGTPALTRTDATVDFDWTDGAPDPNLPTNSFQVRWTGQVQPLYSQDYSFRTASDDGVRLWVNGQLAINNWTLHAPTTNTSAAIPLVAGQKYDVMMEFFENAGGAVARLFWYSPSQPLETIPQLQLYPAAGALTPPTTFTYTTTGTNLVFNWGIGTYSVVWSTNVVGPYTNVIPGVVSPFTNAIGSEPQKFFKLWFQ